MEARGFPTLHVLGGPHCVKSTALTLVLGPQALIAVDLEEKFALKTVATIHTIPAVARPDVETIGGRGRTFVLRPNDAPARSPRQKTTGRVIPVRLALERFVHACIIRVSV